MNRVLFLLYSQIFFLTHSFSNELLIEPLKERFGSKIEVEILSDLTPFNIQSARLIEERTSGKFDYFINGEQKITVELNIFVPAYFPKNKITPKQKLSAELFQIKKINIVRDFGKDIRATLISTNENLLGYFNKYTLLPQDALTLNAIQKVPDIKNGDRASLKLWVEGVLIHTPIIVQQEGYVGDLVKVEITSTKKILQGILLDPQTVEVKI